MNTTIISYLNDLGNFFGAYLDRLKIKNPLIFMLVSGGLLIGNLGFALDKINISDEVDSYVILVLGVLNTYISPRTSTARKQYENDSNDQLLPSNDNLEPASVNEPSSDSKFV